MRVGCMSWRRCGLAVVTAAVLAGTALSAGAGNTHTVWDGVYTAEQAARGMALMKSTTGMCTTCHADNMKGSPVAPTLIGPEFMFGWAGRSLGELFDYIRTMMPPGQAGTLGDQAYADLVAAVLQLNHFPAADSELAPNMAALQMVTITRKPPE